MSGDVDFMRAVVMTSVGPPDVLQAVSIPRPVRVGAEFLVKVIAAGVNPVDAKTRAGAGHAAAITEFPALLGNDFSGIVVESPYDAHPLKVGDAVFGMSLAPRLGGTYAEYVSVPASFLTRKPKALSHVEAAAVPLAALTAWGAVVEVAKAHEGQRMLIHGGSGGVGHFAVQFAEFFGARVIATASTGNLAWLRELGAAETVDYTEDPFEEVLDPVDVVIDLVGGEVGRRSLSVLKPGGHLVSVPSGDWPTVAADAAAVGKRGTGFRVGPDSTALGVVTRLLESGDVRVFVDQVFELDAAASAHRAVESGHTRGKIVLTVADV